jgi:hypothetical protein
VSSLASDHTRFPYRDRAAQQGPALPSRPPTVDEIVAVMRQAGHDRHGHRISALIVGLWRAGLQINEALSN